MSHIITRRSGGALAVASIAGILLAGPSFAGDPDAHLTGSGRSSGSDSEGALPGDVRHRDPSGGGFVPDAKVEGRYGNVTSPGKVSPASPDVVAADGITIEYLQVGLGALGGMAAVGLFAAGMARRSHHSRPATA